MMLHRRRFAVPFRVGSWTLAALVAWVAGARAPAWALTCTDFTQPAAAELLARLIRDLPGDRIDFSGDGIVDAGDAVVALRIGTAQMAPPEGCRGPDLLSLADVCLNVASGLIEPAVEIQDQTDPDAQFVLLPDANPSAMPEGDFSLTSDGRFGAVLDGPEDVGDYAFAIASSSTRFDVFNAKVVDDPAPAAFPAPSRPFLLGVVPTQGRHDYTFSNGGAITLPHPAGAAAFFQAIGSADLALIQTFPEWATPYDSLTGFLVPTVETIREASRDVILALDLFGSGFRDKILVPADDLAEVCADCGLGTPNAEMTGCTGGEPLFQCAGLRTRFGDYAEAVAEALRPPYLILGVEINFYEFSKQADYPNFATAFKAAAQRVKAVSPETKVFVSLQYEGMVAVTAAFARVFLGITDPAVIANRVRAEFARVLPPLAPENELFAVTTFPELMRKVQLRQDDSDDIPFEIPFPFPSWSDPADIPDDYYMFVTEVLGTPGYPPRAAVMESGWSTRDPDTFECEDYAFFPLTQAGNLYNDGITDPAVTHRTEAGQQRALHRLVELMYDRLHPEFFVWFYARDPTQIGAPPVLPIFQTMGFRRDLWTFDGECTGVPDTAENEARVAVHGEESKAAYCDWLRLYALPYVP